MSQTPPPLDPAELLRGLFLVALATGLAVAFAVVNNYQAPQIVSGYNAALVYGAALICLMFAVCFQRVVQSSDSTAALLVVGLVVWELLSTVVRVGFWTAAALEGGEFMVRCQASGMSHLTIDELWASARHFGLNQVCEAGKAPYPQWAIEARDALGLLFVPAPLAAALILRALLLHRIGFLWWALPATIAWAGVVYAW